jgi:hypothetical protein
MGFAAASGAGSECRSIMKILLEQKGYRGAPGDTRPVATKLVRFLDDQNSLFAATPLVLLIREDEKAKR